MKREIKFRAWDNNSSIMIEEVGVGSCSIGFPSEDDLHEELKSKGYDPENYKLPENWDDTGEDWYLILDNYVLMQFTGLKDKNGVDIYEGDIVVIVGDFEEGDNYYEIKWNAEQYMIAGKDVGFNNDWLNLEELEECEVTGNIYENPELL